MKNNEKNSPIADHGLRKIKVYFRESKEKSGEGFVWICFYVMLCSAINCAII